MKVLIWLVEGTWEGCVAAARALLPADAEVTLVYVADAEVPEAAGGAMAGLLGRGRPGRDPGRRIAALSQTAAAQLLEAAAGRLGRPARRVLRAGRVEREVVKQAAGADLLVAARDGDRSRLGPRSLPGAAGMARPGAQTRLHAASTRTRTSPSSSARAIISTSRARIGRYSW